MMQRQWWYDVVGTVGRNLLASRVLVLEMEFHRFLSRAFSRLPRRGGARPRQPHLHARAL